MMSVDAQRKLLRTPVASVARARQFPLGGVRVQRTKDALKRAHGAQARRLVKASNAEALIEEWPQPGETTHALLPGDFVFGDLIDVMMARFGTPDALWISTLSLSDRNVETLQRAASRCPLHFFLSTYFQNTSKELFAALQGALERHRANWTLTIARVHTKVLLWEQGDTTWSIESSANLRSSNSLEFATVFTDAAVFFFHRDWMREMEARAQAQELEGFAAAL